MRQIRPVRRYNPESADVAGIVPPQYQPSKTPTDPKPMSLTDAASLINPDPKTWEEAMSGPQAEGWAIAAKKQI